MSEKCYYCGVELMLTSEQKEMKQEEEAEFCCGDCLEEYMMEVCQ